MDEWVGDGWMDMWMDGWVDMYVYVSMYVRVDKTTAIVIIPDAGVQKRMSNSRVHYI